MWLRKGLAAAAAGEVVFTCLPDESAYNPIGIVHGCRLRPS